MAKTTKSAEVTRQSYSFSSRLRAFQEYLEDVPLADIAVRNDIKLSTLKQWISSNKWAKRKKEFQAKSITEIEKKYQHIVRRNQLEVLNRKLQLAAIIDKSLRRRLLNPDGTLRELGPEALRNISDAFAKNANIDGKLLGLLTPRNEMSVFVGSGAMVNIGVQGSPLSSLPSPKAAPVPVNAETSSPPYEGTRKTLTAHSEVPF